VDGKSPTRLLSQATVNTSFSFPVTTHTSSGGWPYHVLHGGGIGESRGVNGIRLEALPGMLDSRPTFPFIVVSPRVYNAISSVDALDGSPTAVNSMYVLLNEFKIAIRWIPAKHTLPVQYRWSRVWNLGINHPEKFAALAPVAVLQDPYVLTY